MIKRTLKHLKRAPVPAIALLLFSVIISAILCTLQASNDEEVRHFEEACRSIPVKINVVAQNGERKGLIKSWTYDLFTGKNPVKILDVSLAKDPGERASMVAKGEDTAPEISLAEYVKDVQVVMHQIISTVNTKNFNAGTGNSCLYGITSLSADKQLLPEYGCEITWYEGYDESIFDGDEPVCIIPADMANPRFYDNGNGEAELYFLRRVMVSFPGLPSVEEARYEYQCTLKIVGTYTAGDGKSIYCPVPIIEQVFSKLQVSPTIDSLSATLADNRRMEEFREEMRVLFAEPSPDAEPLPCGYCVYNRSFAQNYLFYVNALDIDDENLRNLTDMLDESLKVNRTCTLIVFILSVAAGFLVGFLMIRRRKRDIMLMRSVGESTFSLYVGFVLEQMICIVLGIALGGAYYTWHPVDKLALFAVVYLVALTLALVIFLSKKLIRNIKEDE